MLIDESSRITEPFFGSTQRVTIYRGPNETLIQADTLVPQAEGREPRRFVRVENQDGPEELGGAVLSALQLTGDPEDRTSPRRWILMRSTKPDVLALWKKLVTKAVICLVERSAFSIAIVPTKKWPAEKEVSGFAPIEKMAIHLPVDVDRRDLGERLLEAFGSCE